MKIIFCTTFRDFKGSANDQIQYMFLDNLKSQTYQDFILVTTTFGEKNVKNVVDEYFNERSIVFNCEMPANHRFSLTDVVLSGIKVAEELQEESIIVWCTCDILLEKTFCEKLISNFQKKVCGIVHPNIIYSSLDALNKKEGVIGQLHKGIDILFFDSSVLIEAKQEIIDYRFYDWGVFEYFLVALSCAHSDTLINLFSVSKVKKIVNDRVITKESADYFKKCIDQNFPILGTYIKNKGLLGGVANYIEYQAHLKYKVLNKDFLYLKTSVAYKMVGKKAPKKILKRLHLCRVCAWFVREELLFNK